MIEIDVLTQGNMFSLCLALIVIYLGCGSTKKMEPVLQFAMYLDAKHIGVPL